LEQLKRHGPLSDLLSGVAGNCTLASDFASNTHSAGSKVNARAVRMTYMKQKPDAAYLVRPLLASLMVMAALSSLLNPRTAKVIFEPADSSADRAKLRPAARPVASKLRYQIRRLKEAKARNAPKERFLAPNVAAVKAIRGQPVVDVILNKLKEVDTTHRWDGFVANSADGHVYDYSSNVAQVSALK
jgi:hypothetical protein